MQHYADYKLAAEKAIEVLEEYDISQAPISLQEIIYCLRREIQIMPYSKFMAMNNFSKEYVIDYFDSRLGTCYWMEDTNQYLIFYNDIDFSEQTNRFTVAHELGHIFLKHHEKVGVNVLKRSALQKEEYEEYEKEANAFARNLLSPAPLALYILNDLHGQESDLQKAFNISDKAAHVRFEKLKRDLKDYSFQMLQFIKTINVQYRRICRGCKSEVPLSAKYCPICGHRRPRKGFPARLLPHMIPVTKERRFTICPVCGNAEISNDSNYCRVCGTILYNKCSGSTNKNTGRFEIHKNASYASFCTTCGKPTHYSELGIVQTEDTMIEKKDYNDGVDYDPQTMRVKICPRCGNTQFSENAYYCRICGTDLYNYCDGSAGEGQHVNPSNARFCETCGAPTYFGKNILPSYKNYKEPDIQALPESDSAEDTPWMRIPEDNAATVTSQAMQKLSFEIPEGIDEELPFS